MGNGTGTLELGLLLPTVEGWLGNGRSASWTHLRDMARVAEGVGFASVLAADHLLFRNSETERMVPEGETRGIWECWTILSAIAAVTSRVTLGTFVICNNFRNPALLAKMADTLDEVSGGRHFLGLGAGWVEVEHIAFGLPYRQRVGRFAEALQIIAPLLREGKVDFVGQHYQVRDCELRPRGPRPQGPPIWIGAQSPVMMRLVAEWADVYNTDFKLSADEVAAALARLDAACRDAGRDPATIGRTGGLRLALDPPPAGTPGTKLPTGVTTGEVDISGLKRQVVWGPPEAIAEHLRAFAAQGVTHITCQLATGATPAGVERFGRIIESVRRPA